MRRDMLRYSGWVGIALLLALLLISGCTRAKSSGPPEATAAESSPQATSETPSVEPSPTTELSGQEVIDATATAWAVETATAAAPTAQQPEGAPTNTPESTQPPAATAPAATEAPEPTATPEPTTAEPTQAPAATQPAATTGEKTHVVKAGENLFRIALSYDLTTQELAAYNGIANPNLIYVGQELKIPPGGGTGTTPPPPSETGYHVVKAGENLFRIALQYNMLYTALAQANGLSYPYTIYTGQKLIIP